MKDLVSSELLKIRTTRTFFGVAGSGLGIFLLITILAASLGDWEGDPASFADLIGGSGFVAIFALVIGILAISTEFRHGTVTPSLLAVPDRARWAVSKLLANGAAGLAFGFFATAASIVAVLLIFASRGISIEADIGVVLKILVGSTLSAGLLAALGVGLGAIIRNQAGAIVVGLLWLFVIEALLAGLVPGLDEPLTKYGVNGLLSGITNTESSSLYLGQIPAGLLLALYAVIVLAAGIALLQRRDVSANSS